MTASSPEHISIEMTEIQKEVAPQSTTSFHSSFDDDMLRRAVRDAGRWAYGTVMVEVWVMNQDQTALYRPTSGGWWIDAAWHHHHDHHHDGADASDCHLCRNTDPATPGYIEPPPVAPGVGLAGVLWAESSSMSSSSPGSTRRGSLLLGRRGSLLRGRRGSMATSQRRLSGVKHAVVWRDLDALQKDPDQPHDGRLKRVVDSGLGYAGGVAFDFHGETGIVVFAARAGVDLDRLRSSTNEAYLLRASNLIGSAWALRGPRMAVERERRRELDAALRRARIKLQALARMGLLHSQRRGNGQPSSEVVPPPKKPHEKLKENLNQSRTTGVSTVKQKMVTEVKKCRGGGVEPASPMSIEQSLWTFVGVFCTLLILTRMNADIDDKYDMELGPFGALMTLQYGLTAAPASQPPNAILGQAVSLSIAIGIGSIRGMDLWLRQSLATALAVTSMVKLGLTHPPAGAAALIFAKGTNSWGNMGMMLVGNVIAIVTATLINNLNAKRQYPTWWGFGFALDKLRGYGILPSNINKGKDETERSVDSSR